MSKILDRGKLESIKNRDGSPATWKIKYIGKDLYEAIVEVDKNCYSGFDTNKTRAIKEAVENYGRYLFRR